MSEASSPQVWDWFGVRLRELREAAGLSRPQLAERAGMRSEAGIRNLEQGLSNPTWETVLRLASALGVDCKAFTRQPAAQPPAIKPGPGRPSKATEESIQVIEKQAEPPPASGKRRKPAATALPPSEPLALEGEVKEGASPPLSLPPAQAKHARKPPRKPRG